MTRLDNTLSSIEDLWFKCRPLADLIRGSRDIESVQLELVKMIYTDNLIDTLDALAGRLFEK